MVLILINNSLHIFPPSENDLFKGTLFYVLRFLSCFSATIFLFIFSFSASPFHYLRFSTYPLLSHRSQRAVYRSTKTLGLFYTSLYRFGIWARVGRNFILSFHFDGQSKVFPCILLAQRIWRHVLMNLDHFHVYLLPRGQ